MKGINTILFLLVIQWNLNAQSASELDSLNKLSKSMVCREVGRSDSVSNVVIRVAQKNNFHSQWGYALKNKAVNQICQGQLGEALKILNQAASQFELANDLKGEAIIFNYKASAYQRLNQLDSAINYNNKQLKTSLEIKDSMMIAASYQMKSNLFNNETDSILFYALKGLRIAEAIGYESGVTNFNISISNVYHQNEDYTESLKYALKAMDMLQRSNNTYNLNMLYYNIGLNYVSLNELDSAFSYYQKSIELNKAQGRKYLLAYSYQGIADLYFKRGEYDKAIDNNLLSMKLSLELNEKKSLMTVTSNLVACYTQKGDLSKAITTAQEALVLAKEVGDINKEADTYWLLSEAYEKLGQYKLSLKAYKDFYSLDSTLLNKNKSLIINDLNTKYETEKKETEIASLSQQATIQALEIKQKNIGIAIGLSVLFLLSTGAYFIYRQHALKRKQGQIELEQRFLRSQLNPHFIFNALQAIQNFMLKNEAKMAALYLTKFSKLMREILENSREEYISVDSEIEMLTNYLDIHKLRLNDSFDYQISIDDSIESEVDTIPPMFVQPFVENAIEHGITHAEGKGLIELNFSKQGEYISIEVRDNGGGVTAKINPKEHKSLASTIIKERMALFNKSLKDKIQLVIDEMKNDNGNVVGTRVELKVPYGIG